MMDSIELVREQNVDARLARWGKKVDESNGTRKTFIVQLDWFKDHEYIRTIAELKESKMFASFIRMSLRMVGPLLLYGDTDGILATGERGGERGELEIAARSEEMQLMRRMISIAEEMSYGVSVSTVNGDEKSELPSSSISVITDEMQDMKQSIVTELFEMLQSAGMSQPNVVPGVIAQKSQPLVESREVANTDDGFGLSEEIAIDDSWDDEDFTLEDLMVDGGSSPGDGSISKMMLKSALGMMDDG